MENDPRHTAVHEAGHAVIGRVLTMVCGHATIQADHDSAGHGVIEDPLLIYGHWDAEGKYRDYESVLRGRIMSFMAGAEAEFAILGKCHGGGDEDDQLQCAYMAEALQVDDAYLERLRRHTRRLVRHHRQMIERLADGLVEHTTLSGEQIDELLAI